MRGKLMVGVIAAALLLSGGLVGVSFAGAADISEPQVIELSFDDCGGTCRIFELQDPVFGRPGEAWIVVNDDPLFDVDGAKVGHRSEQCTVSYGNRRDGGTPWVCTSVITLKAGPHTELGTVVTTGIFDYDGSTWAVTGGTGAYANVRGSATVETVGDGDDQHEVMTLNLIP